MNQVVCGGGGAVDDFTGPAAVRRRKWDQQHQGKSRVKLPALFMSGAKQHHDEEKAERERARLERKFRHLPAPRTY